MKTRIHALFLYILFLNLLNFGMSTAVSAHHSFAMFDHKGTITLIGTVTKFQWTNPHAYLELDVHAADGRMTHYTIEMTSINMMRRLGWKSGLMHAGDNVKVTMAALLSGKPGGLMLDVTLPNGDVWETGVPAANTYVRTPEIVVGVPRI
jgi:hypothetical protein